MLKRLQLNNLQSHKSSDIIFGKRVNVLLGKSNAGKTTIFRALDWIENNSTSGSKLLSSFAKRGDICSAKLLTTDGQVERFYSKSTNGYKLNGVELKAIGKGTPQEVSDALNFSDLNTKSQHDPFFMLNDSGGKIAKRLNELVDLEIIDTTISNLNSKSRALNSKLKFKKEELEEKNLELEKYKDVDYAIGAFKKIEVIVVEKETTQKEIVELSKMILDLENFDLSRFDGVDEASEMLVDITSCKANCDLIDTSKQELSINIDSVVNLSSKEKAISKLLESESDLDDILATKECKDAIIATSNEIRANIESIYLIREEMKVFDGIDEALVELDGIEKIGMKLESIDYDRCGLNDYLTQLNIHKKNKVDLDSVIEELEIELKDEMGDVCPLCGGEL